MSDEPQSSPLAPAISPLLEADPNSINELIQERINDIFNKPPLLLSDDDLRVAVEYYRKERQRFMLESAAKPPRAAGAKRKTPTSVSEALSSSEDLL
jgi:hypothetical protein